MITFDYTITDRDGIHARPAGNLVRLAGTFESSIKLEKDDKAADAKKIFAVMGLGAKQGETLRIFVEGGDESIAAKQLLAFLQENM